MKAKITLNLFIFLILDTDSHVLWQTMKSQTKPMKGGISSGSALLVNFF